MNLETKIKLDQILANNAYNPLIVVGNFEPDSENCVFLMAGCDERELHIPGGWHLELQQKAAQSKVLLVIAGLDCIAAEKQQKFAGLLKDRRAGNYKLPDNAQIVIPVADKNALSKRILALSLLWEIKE